MRGANERRRVCFVELVLTKAALTADCSERTEETADDSFGLKIFTGWTDFRLLG